MDNIFIHNNRVFVNGECIGTGTEVSYTFTEDTWTRIPHHPVIDFINNRVPNKEDLQEEWLEEAVQMIDKATYPILKKVLAHSLQTNESPVVAQEKLGLQTLGDSTNYESYIEEELVSALHPPKLASEITKYMQNLQTKKHR